MSNNKIYIKSGVFFLLTILLSSCLITKKYTQPVWDEADLFRVENVAVTDSLEAPIQWKTFFNDSVLITYIDSALANNYDNLIAFKTIERFEALYKQGKAGSLPTFDIEANGQRQQQAENSQFGSFFSEPFSQYTVTGRLSWEADIWGKIKSQKLASQARFNSSVTAQKAMQTQLISSISTTYYQLLEADESRNILEENIRIREENLVTIQYLKAAGKSNSLAVSQSEAQLEQTKTALNLAKQRVFNLENALVLLIGKPLKEFERSSLAEQHPEDILAKGFSGEVIRNRPDVQRAELNFRASFEDYNVSKAAMYPTLKLSAEAGFQSLDLSTWLTPTSLFNTLTAGITQPVFNRRRLKTEKEVAQIQMDQSLLEFKKVVLTSSVEVSNELKAYQIQSDNVVALEHQEEILIKSLSDSQELLKGGFIDYLNVLIAQENLLKIQIELAKARSGKMQSLAMVYKSIGGGVM